MSQIRIKHVDPFQMGKVYFIIMAFISLIIVIPFILLAGIIGSSNSEFSQFSGIMGVGIAIAAVIFYSIFGFIMGFLGALIYNFTYTFHKGILFSTEDTISE